MSNVCFYCTKNVDMYNVGYALVDQGELPNQYPFEIKYVCVECGDDTREKELAFMNVPRDELTNEKGVKC